MDPHAVPQAILPAFWTPHTHCGARLQGASDGKHRRWRHPQLQTFWYTHATHSGWSTNGLRLPW